MGFKSEEIKELRTRFALSKAKFAKKIGVGLRTAQFWETGERIPSPPVQKLMRLLDIGIDFDELLKKGKP